MIYIYKYTFCFSHVKVGFQAKKNRKKIDEEYDVLSSERRRAAHYYLSG